MKKIAILTNYPADHATFTGGVETATASLLEGLCNYQEEFEFHVISVPKSLTDDKHERRGGVYFHFLHVPQYTWARPRLLWRVLNAYSELRRISPDLVHCQDNMALALATILSGYNRVFTIHGVKRHEASKRTGWEYWSANMDAVIEKYVYRHFSAFICVSDYASNILESEGKKRKFAIPNPVNVQFFKDKDDSEITTQAKLCLLFAGVLTPLKRPHDLLQAHQHLRDHFPKLETVFCGEVQDKAYVEAMYRTIIRQGIEGVRFLGRVDQRQLADLLAGATALVLPSSQENSPMVIAEAMASGVPVVATRVGGIPSMIQHGRTGLLYDAGNVVRLIDCLKRLLMQPALCHIMGQHARQEARKRYSPIIVADATVAAYRQLLDQ